jgi:hypothetical protein
MSKIEVNTVEPQCGTTLTLGACGDTVALGSGAAQTGFGRTGTVDWITTPKVTGDSPITGVTGKGYFLNTTAGTITVNLPVGAAGSIVSVADYAATWQTNNVTVAANGTEKIGGVDADVTLSTEGQSVTFVYVDSTQGWINTMDSTSNVRGNAYMIATGGTITCSGNDKIHKFTGPGTFTVSAAAVCAADNLVSYMVVAGGGGGGKDRGGGGGAGGFREVESPSTPYTSSPLDGYATPGNRITVTATGYPITVGAGATGVTTPQPAGSDAGTGANSVFSTITSAGGGRAGSGPSPYSVGGDGGSGGGSDAYGCPSSAPNMAAGSGNTPPTTPAQGTNGGVGVYNSPNGSGRGGGGGGATVAGTATTPGGNPGGAGATTEITASPVAYGGGGGGGDCGSGQPTGGAGGGGAGGSSCAAVGSGTVNTGGGAGGSNGGTGCGGGGGGAGGSGIVIIRYKFQ